MNKSIEMEREGLLQDIIAHKDEDAPRLIYSDWCEDHGESDRAEFIRVQCRLVKMPDGPIVGRGELSRRKRDILFDHWPKWIHEGFDHMSHDVGVSARDDNDFGVSFYDSSKGEKGHFDIAFSRGFISRVRCPLADWLTHGHMIAKAHPVEKVAVTDKSPCDQEIAFGLGQYARKHVWYVAVRNQASISVHHLPPVVSKAVDKLGPFFDTEQLAADALSRALITLAEDARPCEKCGKLLPILYEAVYCSTRCALDDA
jgi:uncharacterized protein (TIGR02996 family)